jgi:hypothetical protein
VIEGLEAELGPLPDLAQGDVVLVGLAVGHLRLGKVRQRDQQLIPPLVELAQLRLELLELGLQRTRLLARLRELRLARLPGPGRLLDLAGELVLLGPDRVDPGVELAAALIDPEELIDLLGGASPGKRRADPVGVGADLLQVERGSVPRARWRRPSGRAGGAGGRLRGPRLLWDVLPGVLRDEGGDLLRVLADDDVLGHDRPREAAVPDREDHILHRLRALIEVGALYPLAAVGGPLRPRRFERVTARAALGEDLGALVGRVVGGDLNPLRPAAGGNRERGNSNQ